MGFDFFSVRMASIVAGLQPPAKGIWQYSAHGRLGFQQVVETDCALLAINRNVFLNLVTSGPTFGISLPSAMAERVRNTAAGIN